MIHNWITGTLELSSKVRYGVTSKGVPRFRFIPYDKRFPPMAVGCSTRDLFYNIRVAVEPQPGEQGGQELPKGFIVQNDITETDVLLGTYAYDSQKSFRKEPPQNSYNLNPQVEHHRLIEGFTFHIDPPGCKDADDSITIVKLQKDVYEIYINIADVDAWVPEGSTLDLSAKAKATSFYTPDGNAIAPMLPRILSEKEASLSALGRKPTLSLKMLWKRGEQPTLFEWIPTLTECHVSFTYESVLKANYPEIEVLQEFTTELGANPDDSHTWVEALMILYNTKAGELLKEHQVGILRKHGPPNPEKVSKLEEIIKANPSLFFLALDSAEYCLPTDSETNHFGLEKGAYAYASSPLRRYADIVNQRALKKILFSQKPTPSEPELISELNRREKQAKAFQRDYFFSNVLLNSSDEQPVAQGQVITTNLKKKKYEVLVFEWKKIIKVKTIDFLPEPGTKIDLTWYCDANKPRWKERIVFNPILNKCFPQQLNHGE